LEGREEGREEGRKEAGRKKKLQELIIKLGKERMEGRYKKGKNEGRRENINKSEVGGKE